MALAVKEKFSPKQVGIEKKAASPHKLVPGAQNSTVLNERVQTGDQEKIKRRQSSKGE